MSYENEDNNSEEQQGRYEEDYPETKVDRKFVVPDSKQKLLACENCRLIKTEAQWKSSNSCENCRHNRRDDDYKKFTTNKFEGMVAMMDTTHSWLRRKLLLGSNLENIKKHMLQASMQLKCID